MIYEIINKGKGLINSLIPDNLLLIETGFTKTSQLINDGEDGEFSFVPQNILSAVAFSGDYSDLINTPNDDSAFQALDEGSGIGTRLKRRSPDNFGTIGDDAFDISYSSSASSTRGATGTGSVAIGEDVIASGYGAYSMGYIIDNSAIYSLGVGLNSQLGGYAVNTFGVGHQVSGLAPFVVGQAAEIINDNLLDWNSFPEKILFAVGNGTIQNADTEYTVLTRSNALQVRMNGLVEAPSVDNTKIDAELTGKVLVTREWVEANLTYPQDLQGVLDQGTSAQYGDYYAEILTNVLSSKYTSFGYSDEIRSNSLYLGSNNILISSELNSNNSVINLVEGELTISKRIGIIGVTNIKIKDPTLNTNLMFPAKNTVGDYTINTTPDTIYTVATLPAGILNDMAIVSDATAPTYLGTLVGGGAVVCPVWNNGTNWVSR